MVIEALRAFPSAFARIRRRAPQPPPPFGPRKIGMNIQQVLRAPAIRLRVRRRVFTDLSGRNKSVSRGRGLYVFHKQTHMVQADRVLHVICASPARWRNSIGVTHLSLGRMRNLLGEETRAGGLS